MKRCHDILSERIAASRHQQPIRRQLGNDFQKEVGKDENNYQNIDLNQQTIQTQVIDLEEKVELMIQELMKMKIRMARYERLGQYD